METNLKLLEARAIFVEKYCAEKGWDFVSYGDLSMEQVLEIRQQDGWKNPKIL